MPKEDAVRPSAEPTPRIEFRNQVKKELETCGYQLFILNVKTLRNMACTPGMEFWNQVKLELDTCGYQLFIVIAIVENGKTLRNIACPWPDG